MKTRLWTALIVAAGLVCGSRAQAGEFDAIWCHAEEMQPSEKEADPKEGPDGRARAGHGGPAAHGGCHGQCHHGCPCCCCEPRWGWEAFLGAGAYRNALDDTRSNNFGFLSTANVGMLVADNLGWQAGMSYAAYDLHGRAADPGSETRLSVVEENFFFTTGPFKRSNVQCGDPWSWGAVYDYMHLTNFGEDAFGSLDMHQFRLQFGYALSCCDEIGFWGNFELEDDTIADSDNPQVRVWITEQYNLYWKRHWCCGADTVLYAGIPDGDQGEAVFGMNVVAPLDCNWAFVGGWHYILPSTTGGVGFASGEAPPFRDEVWNLFVGISYSPGGYGACTVSGKRWMPLLPVANHGYMPITIDRRENL